MMSDAEKENNAASTSPEEDEKASKASSEATAPQASPKKVGSEFHHHVVPTEKSGAINVYVQVNTFLWFLSTCITFHFMT